LDELAYQTSRQGTNPSPCIFEKAILSGCATCGLAKRLSLAERENVACTFEVARINCSTLESLFRERATFALRLPRPGLPVVHAKNMQLQCGGLRGLQTVLAAPELDIHTLVQQAQANNASLMDLSWRDIVNSIAAWQLRRRTPLKPSG
jgi:hypothetical protein